MASRSQHLYLHLSYGGLHTCSRRHQQTAASGDESIAVTTTGIPEDGSSVKRKQALRMSQVRSCARIGYCLTVSLFAGAILHQATDKSNSITVIDSIVGPRVFYVDGARKKPLKIREDPYDAPFKKNPCQKEEEEKPIKVHTSLGELQLVTEKQKQWLRAVRQTDLNSGWAPPPEGSKSPENTCRYKHVWALASFPTCNKVHEVELLRSQLVNNGNYRDVFAFAEYDGSKHVLKELRYFWDFGRSIHEINRDDAVSMERLTESEHIADIYANCNSAGLFDFSPDGDLEQHVLAGGEHYRGYTGLEKLKIASQVAAAIADVHDMDIVHTDISAKQFLLVNGHYVLNDFNRCEFVKLHAVDNTTCAFTYGDVGDGRSPEEYNGMPLTQKIDVFSMGTVFYYMLAEHVVRSRSKRLIMKGLRPGLIDAVSNSADPSIQALIHAKELCQAQAPEDRPTARNIEKYLLGELKRIKAL